MAYRISQLAVTEITYVVGQTAFPAYSKLQGELADLQRGYFRVAGFSATLSLPTATAIAMLGTDFTRVFLGEQWLPMAPVLALLALAALVKSIASTGSPLFMGSGSPQSEFQIQLVRGLTVAVLILPLSVTWGMSGAAFTVVLSGLGMLTVWYIKIKDQLQLAPTDLAGVLSPPFFSSLAMAGAIHLFRFLSQPLFPAAPPMQIAWFLLAVVFAVGIYSTAIYLCQRVFPKHQVLQEVARAIRR
jgi:O-antigen/teichoic acid export membrane protein